MPANVTTLQSMTAFASQTGQVGQTGQMGPVSWAWEMRGVNARGLDVRFRLPDGTAALEAKLRAHLAKHVKRGTITVNLRTAELADEGTSLTLDPDHLDRVLHAFDAVQDRALVLGITLAQPTAADVLAQRGVIAAARAQSPNDRAELMTALEADFHSLVTAFCQMRRAEGAALSSVIHAQVDRIAELTRAATEAAQARREPARAALTAALARVMEDTTVDEVRVAQELALLAVKSDITEEIDRLHAHVAAARDLLAGTEPQGRKLDFLAQEFNREANTLCSKAGSAPLTAIGLELKAAIEQMREQIQNVE